MGKLLELALSGDMTAIKYVYDRLDGRPSADLNLGSDPDAPLQITTIVTDRKRPTMADLKRPAR